MLLYYDKRLPTCSISCTFIEIISVQMKNFLCFFLVLGSVCAYAQKKQLTMQDAMVNNRTSLAPETLKQLQFIKGTNGFVFVKKINGEETWVKGTVSNIEGSAFLTLSEINRRVRLAGVDTFKTLPPVQFNNDNYVLSIKGSKYSFFNSKDSFMLLGEAKAVGKEAVDESKAGYVAFADSFNLYVAKNGIVKKVTTDGSAELVYGRAVHQQEFGITKGTFWNDAGDKLAFYRMDQSMVPDYPIIDWTKRPAKANFIKYPMAGDASHHVTLGIYDAKTDRIHYLKTGLPAEQYLTNIAWAPDGRSIYIAVLNRGQNHMKLNQYDVATGEFVKTLFEEQHEKYVEPLVPMLFLKNDPSMFVWQSRRDGWNHLYLYDTNGKMIRQLTSGQWEVTSVKGFNAKGDKLYYVSTAVSPLSRNLYAVDIKNARSAAITSGNFNHNVSVDESGEYLLDNYSSPANARTIELVNIKSGKRTRLLQAKDPLQDFELGAMSIFTLKSNDGHDLYARLFKPVNFDSTKKYPVVVYWYGGPHAQLILNSYNGGAGDYWFQYMAQRGYLVFTIDTRGSANRGREFEQTIFRKAGTAQMEDMMTGVNYLKSLPYVDASRMGLFGWSYGGFMTTNFMLTHPGVFKTAVAGGPVIDWKYYEIMYTERYMDTPQENPGGYEETDLNRRVDRLKGNLLLIHGMQDPVVVQQHSVNFVKAAVDKGVQVDYMIYPGHEHNVLGKDRAHLYQKVTDYLMQNL